MNDQPQYSEKSGFPSWIFWLIAIIPASIFFYERIYHPLDAESFDWFGLVIVGAIGIFIFAIKLKVNINAEGISYQFPPFHNKPNLLSWEKIESIELKKINPLKEFGGWGLRYGKLGTAYTTRGRYILHIKLHSGIPINLTIAQPEYFIATVAQQNWPIKLLIPEMKIS
ncbi:MAG: hypothetical protein NTZ00_04085 [Bacteroidetes bacterium]|nr:hypothetical protein [Bacteroidota bacterium]